MKHAKILIMAVFGTLALSVASTRGQQVLSLTGTVEGSLTGQTLFNSANNANDGTVSSWVVSDSGINSGGYIFIYQIEDSGLDDMTGINFNTFVKNNVQSALVVSNVVINSSSLPTPTDVSPDFSYDTTTSGGAATFNGDLAPQQTSWFMVIETDATGINTGFALTQDDFQTHGEIYAENFAVYTVPEPSSAILLLAGCACFYAVLRFRRSVG
jgi:hypothetical protein